MCVLRVWERLWSPGWAHQTPEEAFRERPNACRQRGRGFNNSSALIAHKQVHFEGKLSVCRECGQVFIQKSRLTYIR